MKPFLIITTKQAIYKVNIEEIVYIERFERKLLISTDKESFEYYEKIENVEPLLNEDFYKCHARFIVNLKKVTGVRDQTIFFSNDEMVYVGRNNFVKIKKAYYAFLVGLSAFQVQ